MSQPDKYLAALKKRYAKATKKERGKMLDEYVKTTGCHRGRSQTLAYPICHTTRHSGSE